MGHGEGGGGGVLRELLAVFGFGVDTKELEHGESKLDEFFEKVKHVGEGIAAAFAVEQLFEFAEGQAHAMTAVEHMAAQIGISTDEVQAWAYAAKASGFEAEKFTNAMSRLQAAAGTEQGGSTFKQLGIGLKGAGGEAKNASELFADVAEKIKNTEDPNKRAAIATKLFGRSGRELLPFLSEGKEGIDELMKAYKELGGAYTQEDIERTKRFEKSQASLSLVWTGMKATIARVLLPIFTQLSTWLAKIVHGFVDLVRNSRAVQATLIVLGAAAGAFATEMLIASAPILLIAAAIGGLVLLVDELITLFNGGDTLIGDAIDKMFGKGAHVEVVKELKEAWQGVKQAFVEAWPYIKKVWDFFAFVLEKGAELVGILTKLSFGTAHKLGKGIGDLIAGSEEPLAQYTGKGNAALPPAFSQFAPTAGEFQIVGMGGPGGVGGPGGAAGNITVEAHIHNDPTKNEHVIRKVAHQVHQERNRSHVNNLPRSGQP